MISKAVAILANPKAGAGLSMQRLREARRVLWGRKYEFFVPQSREEFSRICAGLDSSRFEAVVVLGGDGTLNLAIQELSRLGPSQSLPIYPFPVGTANDLANEMKTTPSWEEVEDLIQAQSFEWIDLVRVNGVAFATVAGIGVGARLTAELNEKRENSRIMRLGLRHLKAPIYSAMAVKTILTARELEREFVIDSGNLRQKIRASALFICNQGMLGGNLCVSKVVDNADNRFSVLVATSSSRLELITALSRLQRGIIPEHFISFSAASLTVECTDQKPIEVFGDGETLVRASRLSFEMVPRGLAVFRGKKRENRA